MNIKDIRFGMQVRVKTFDELESKGYITHIGGIPNFKRLYPFGCLKYRIPYLGGIFRVEEIAGPNVYLGSCYYKDEDGGSIWWNPELLAPVEGQKEFETYEDSTELSRFLESFEVVS